MYTKRKFEEAVYPEKDMKQQFAICIYMKNDVSFMLQNI